MNQILEKVDRRARKLGIELTIPDSEGRSFKACCISHAIELSKHLVMMKVAFVQKGIEFVLADPSVVAPMVARVWTFNKNNIRVIFDKSVSLWAASIFPVEMDPSLESYQSLIEEVEERVIHGLFGDPKPSRIQVRWDDEDLIVTYWRHQ